MTRAPLISVALTVVFAIGCANPATTNNPGLITICVAVVQDPQKSDPTVQVTYPSFASTQNQKLRWCVYNNTKSDLAQLSIEFATGSSACVTTPPPLTGIPAGNDPAMCTAVCDCAATAKEYEYKVVVKTASGGTVEANPRVILN